MAFLIVNEGQDNDKGYDEFKRLKSVCQEDKRIETVDDGV